MSAGCKLCGKPLAYPGAVFCGAACCAQWEGGRRPAEVLCKCGKHPATPLHTCPFKSDVNNDSASLCNCCKGCARECLYDI